MKTRKANTEMLRTLADDYGGIRDQIKELTAMLENLRGRILETGLAELVGSRYLVTVGKSDRQVIDVERLREEQPEVVEEYTYTTEVTTVRTVLLRPAPRV